MGIISTGISRRAFMEGMASVAGVTSMAAAGVALTATGTALAETPVQSMECDVCVVGAGMSGLAAAVQAAELGAKVVCLESTAITGGQAGGVEGIFAVGSKMAMEQGIEVSVGQLVRTELKQNQYRNSGLGIHDLVKASGDDIDWLQEQGCRFGTIDCYTGTEPIFHWYETLTGAESYVVPMEAKARELGVEFVTGAHGDSLLTDAGNVCGVRATLEDGSALEVTAKAVILATGGFATRSDYLAELGYTETNSVAAGMGGDGSGHDMCIAVGGVSNRMNSGMLGMGTIPGMPPFFMGGYFRSVMHALANQAQYIWVNEDGERYCNEDCTTENLMITPNPVRQQKRSYILMDAAMMDEYVAGDETGLKELADGQELGVMIKAASWAELADKIGCDPEALVATIEGYNVCCEEGLDEDFGKDPQFLVPLSTEGEVWAVELRCEIGKTMGGVKTDRSFRVVDAQGDPIPGLYMVGVEGAMIWAGVYTMNISGSCGANNVYSGRTAAKHAVANLL